jgi:hypothetical protein
LVPKRERALFRMGNATPANRAPWDGTRLIEDCVDVRLARSAIRARARAGGNPGAAANSGSAQPVEQGLPRQDRQRTSSSGNRSGGSTDAMV